MRNLSKVVGCTLWDGPVPCTPVLPSGISKPVVWGTHGLHSGFLWFSSLPWFPRCAQLRVCSCLSRLRRFRRFRRSRERRSACKLSNHRFRNARFLRMSPPQNTESGPHRPCFRCAAIRITQLVFIRATFVPRGTAEWHARVDRLS